MLLADGLSIYPLSIFYRITSKIEFCVRPWHSLRKGINKTLLILENVIYVNVKKEWVHKNFIRPSVSEIKTVLECVYRFCIVLNSFLGKTSLPIIGPNLFLFTLTNAFLQSIGLKSDV